MSVAVTASPVWGQPPFGPQKRKRALSDSSTFSLRSFTSSSSYTAPHQPAASTSGFVIVDGQLVGSRARPITAEPAATSVKEGPAGEGRKKKPRPKKYHCTWEGCGKSYTRPVRLQEHERSHTNEVRRPSDSSSRGILKRHRCSVHSCAQIAAHPTAVTPTSPRTSARISLKPTNLSFAPFKTHSTRPLCPVHVASGLSSISTSTGKACTRARKGSKSTRCVLCDLPSSRRLTSLVFS